MLPTLLLKILKVSNGAKAKNNNDKRLNKAAIETDLHKLTVRLL